MSASAALKESIPIIEKAAPYIAGMLGGPAAGSAVAILEKIFGVEDVDGAIASDPEAALKLRQADIQLQIAQINDVASARSREVEISKIRGGHDWFLVTLSLLIVFGFYLSIAVMVYFKIEDSNKETVHYLQDTLGAAFITMFSYYFGSSHRERQSTP